MRPAWLIALKDLRLRLRDRSALLVGLVVPLVLAFVFNLVFGGAFGERSLLTVGLADADGGTVSAGIEEAMAALAGQGVIELDHHPDVASLERAVASGEIASGIYVPAGFSAAAESGQLAELVVVADVDSPTAAAITRGIAFGVASAVTDAQRAAAAAVRSGVTDPELVRRIAETAAQAEPIVAVGNVAAADRVLDPPTFFAAGMAVFFLFFLVQFGVNGLLEEEREGTLPRLAAAPIPRWSPIVGKAITSVLLAIVAMTVLVVASTALMGAEWGSPLGVALLVVAVSVAATSILGVVAALARTPEGAGNLSSVIAVALGMLGGTFFPVAGGNRLVEWLSYATPHSWFLRGVGSLQAGDGLTPLLPSLLALTAFALGVGLVAAYLLRRRFA